MLQKRWEVDCIVSWSNPSESGTYLDIVEGAGFDRGVGLDPSFLQQTDPFQYLKKYNEHLVRFIVERITCSQLEKATKVDIQ